MRHLAYPFVILHADVLLCAFINAGTGVLPFAEDPGSGAG
jgi:hypothetical protein